ncbi:sigma factor [Actinocrinis sp.]|uniref:sigma factor n=1 Tax=Actinocrinis sp. TaxID=1920516 RepID=UPI002C05A0B0|nr:sigma factor [Actinocrinis sp.]HXR72509.1 sigma factor [Actinocrinis sp.]
MSAPGQDPGRPARATSSEACLRRVACGDREAFDQVYAAFAGPVFGLSRRILRDPAQAEEVAQEVLLEVWRTASPTQNSPERAHRAHPPAATRGRRRVRRQRSRSGRGRHPPPHAHRDR